MFQTANQSWFQINMDHGYLISDGSKSFMELRKKIGDMLYFASVKYLKWQEAMSP